jgi:NAD(P)H-flavin reductase
MNICSCEIKQVNPFNHTIYQVILRPTEPVDFQAGQYVTLHLGEEQQRHFSIASAPNSDTIELHIGAHQIDSYTQDTLNYLKNNTHVTAEIAHGQAHLRIHSQRPRLIIVGGTGFGYAKSLIETSIALQQTVPTQLFWGCRQPDHMYQEQLARSWQNLLWLEFVAVLEDKPSHFNGEQGQLLDIVTQRLKDISACDVYVTGRYEMAQLARTQLQSIGLNEDHLFGDAY